MKKISLQKISLLGIVLTAASAIAAAILPSNKKADSVFYFNGSITYSNDNINGSCTATGIINEACHNTTSMGIWRVSGSTKAGISISEATTYMDLD